ncbi:histidine kinase [Saccharopolyspora halophila]|uniref:histidine kinase n=1 Tax=Saccharopolyspora halophila TaxID=405551 RepID=A0ABN3FRR1_9PSEU
MNQQRSWLQWWGGSPRSLLFDLAVAAAPVAGEFYSHGGRLTDTSPIALACLVVGFCALLVRRRFPFPVAVIAALVGIPTGRSALGVTEIALYTVASRRGPRAVTWVAAGVQVTALLLTIAPPEALHASPGFGTSILLLAIGVPLLLGLWVFGRVSALADYRERAEQAERERELLAERAVTEERREIAREMHDVVAHRIGIVSRHAEALAANASDERSGELAETIRDTSVTAMSELHDMLRALRDDPEDEPAAAPALAGIPDLVDDAVRAGGNVRLDMPEPVPEVAPVVGRAAYRVVQESLTNAAKHAPHAAVRVEVTEDADGLVVTVTNRRSPRAHAVALPSSGFGLVGMRERVATADGKLRAEHTDDGGYRVRAVLPLHPDEELADPSDSGRDPEAGSD